MDQPVLDTVPAVNNKRPIKGLLFILLILLVLTAAIVGVKRFQKEEPQEPTVNVPIEEQVKNLPLNEEADAEVSSLLEKAATRSSNIEKFGDYSAAFSQLWGQYNSSPSPETYKTLMELREYIQTNFPEEYENRRQKGIENGTDPWDVKEKLL